MPTELEDAPLRLHRWQPFVAGAFFGSAALAAAPLVGLQISDELGNIEGHTTFLTLFAGVFLTGYLFWWLIVSRPKRISLRRGVVAGVLTAFFAYPVVLSIAEIFQRGWNGAPSLGERVDNVLLVSGLTLLTTGFFGTIIMGVTGVVLALVLGGRPAVKQRRRPSRTLVSIAAISAGTILVALLASFIWLTLMPLDLATLADRPSPSAPSRNYDEAMAAFAEVKAREASLNLHPRCPSTLLTHGQKTARVVIYFHGLTSCPAQGDALGARLFAMGYTVYLPRMFGHGEADPLTRSLADLTAEHLVDLGNESVDMAQGLGEEVVVVGLSAGGTIAAWAAQYRADVDTAVIVSPFFGPYVIPPWATHAATTLTLALPNLVLLWNPTENVSPQDEDYPFPRPATHALAQIMRLGRLVHEGAGKGPPAARTIAMLLNDADIAVSNALSHQLIALWAGHSHQVALKTLPFPQHLPHDLINPREPTGDIEIVYAALIELMNTPPH